MKETKERILDATERCVAELGIAAASIRTITKDAGVNLGAITYHFGSKENLIMEVFMRRMVPMNKERLAMLEAAEDEAGVEPIPLRRVIEAIVIPQRRLNQQYPSYLAFMIRMKNYPNPEFHRLFQQEFSAVFERFDTALREALPPMSEYELVLRMAFFIHLMEFLPENDFHLKKKIPDSLDSDLITDLFVSFLERGVSAPLSRYVPIVTGADTETD